MPNILKAGVILISVCAALVLGTKCRQCKGKQIIVFQKAMTEERATDFFRRSIYDCATGNDYSIDQIEQAGNKWTFSITVWRYCGTGGSNYVSRGTYCPLGICALSDDRTLTCYKTVDCAGYCDKSECGV